MRARLHRRAVLRGDRHATDQAADLVGGDILAGEDRHDAGGGVGLPDVDRVDRRMRVRRTQEIGVSLARTVDVVDVFALAGDETNVFLALDGSAEAGRAHVFLPGMPLIRRLGGGVGAHLARALRDRLDDVVVAGAAADIAFELVADRRLVEVVALAVDHIDRGHDHARRAIAALQAVIVLERLLHRMQLAGLAQAPRSSGPARRRRRRRASCRT